MNDRLGKPDVCFVHDSKVCLQHSPGEDHHVIPRHLGGVDGPVVMLCEKEHKEVHRLANSYITGKTKPYLGLSLDQDRRVRLANSILNAHNLVHNDTNRHIKLDLKIPGSVHKELVFLKQALGMSSQEQVVSSLIHSAYINFVRKENK
jgi:hypothetical protein